jgi:hypothetical protein
LGSARGTQQACCESKRSTSLSAVCFVLLNIFVAPAFFLRSLEAGKKMDSLSLRLSLFVGVHAGVVLAVLLLA